MTPRTGAWSKTTEARPGGLHGARRLKGAFFVFTASPAFTTGWSEEAQSSPICQWAIWNAAPNKWISINRGQSNQYFGAPHPKNHPEHHYVRLRQEFYTQTFCRRSFSTKAMSLKASSFEQTAYCRWIRNLADLCQFQSLGKASLNRHSRCHLVFANNILFST